jgi:heat shock transcription factor 1
MLEERSHCDLISWSDCGNFLVIKDVQEFSLKILPVYFKHSNMNSFVRQLNMYNFHKKRTMTSDHVYYHDLFKRGNVELLKHIKRKHSDGAPGLSSIYDCSFGYSFNTQELTQENLLLKRLNQKAFSQISCLESKVNGLLQENEMLYRKVTEKEKNEEIIECAFSKYFYSENSLKPAPQRRETSCSNLSPSHERKSCYQEPTPNYEKSSSSSPKFCSETTLPLESSSNVDSFLVFEQNDSLTNNDSFTPFTKYSYTELSNSNNIPFTLKDEDNSLNQKRKFSELNHQIDDYNKFCELEPRKIQCTFTDEEPRNSLTDFDLPSCYGIKDERIHS